jgi:flagellum-specific peptidoglycan hydrolase FlgJ/LysM repeat protein
MRNMSVHKKNMFYKTLMILCFLLIFSSCGSTKKIGTSKKPTQNTNVKKPAVTAKPSQNNNRNTSKNSSENSQLLEATSSLKVTPQNVLEYIALFKTTAQHNMRQHGIPASIIMAQGILESGIGKGKLAKDANNHFGIKCHKEWDGDVIYHDDDTAGECFRKYKDAIESYRDHALFLTSRNRYLPLFALDKNDYKGWATGLKNAGYATDPNYPNKLISLIERYELFLLDEEVLGNLSKTESKNNDKLENHLTKPIQTLSKPIDTLKKTKYHVVEAGQTLYSISRLYQLNTDQLMKLNQLESTTLVLGQKLIINKEDEINIDSSTNYENKTHLVAAGDTLFNISKRYNLTLEQLKQLNNLTDNNISLGQILKIK